MKELEYERYILSTHPVLWLPLYRSGGSVIRSADGYGHLATVTGATWGLQGRTFNGTSDKITIPHHAAFNFGTGGFCLAAWVKYTSGYHTASKATDGNNLWWFNWTGGMAVFQLYQAGVAETVNGTTVLTGSWHFVVANRLGGTLAIIVDGVQEASVASSKTMSLTGDLKLGNWVGEWFKGIEGSFMAWNRGLTLVEIQHIYLATKWRY